MKTNDLPLDEVVDTMGIASARLGIPVQVLREVKRAGSRAFQLGSRVNLTELRKELAAATKESSLATLLLNVCRDVAGVVSTKLLEHPDPRFRDDSARITERIQLGLGLTICALEPSSADGFLRESAQIMQNIFKSARQKLPRTSARN